MRRAKVHVVGCGGTSTQTISGRCQGETRLLKGLVSHKDAWDFQDRLLGFKFKIRRCKVDTGGANPSAGLIGSTADSGRNTRPRTNEASPQAETPPTPHT